MDFNRYKTFSNSGRTLLESVLNTELKFTLKLWSEEHKNEGILIGGLAVSFWTKPRMTLDIDFLERNSYVLLPSPGFRKSRPHAFECKKTNAEIEIVKHSLLPAITDKMFDQILETCHIDIETGCKIASVESLIRLKLLRGSNQDKADIEALLKAKPNADLSNWTLSDKEKRQLVALRNSSKIKNSNTELDSL